MTGLKQMFNEYKFPISMDEIMQQVRNKILSILKQIKLLYQRVTTRLKRGDTYKLRQSILDIAVEEYRMRDVIANSLCNLYPVDISRFESRYRYFSKEVEKALDNSGFRIISADTFVGKPFDVGMAVKPLNIKSFSISDELVIEQMIEPVIMDGNTVARIGLVKLRRK